MWFSEKEEERSVMGTMQIGDEIRMALYNGIQKVIHKTALRVGE